MCRRAWLLAMRQDMKFTRFNLKRLHARNLRSKGPVVLPGGPVVSLTTFGERLSTVYLTIESIADGYVLPSRLILWLQDEKTLASRPDSLRRLEARGLEVRLCETYGSHSKYYPYLLSTDAFTAPLATADDDVIYSKWWLQGLSRAHDEFPHLVHCYRAHFMLFTDGAINPYLKWLTRQSTKPSPRCFATGASGIIYPVKFLEILKRQGDKFRELCPRADDVWLHVNELRANFPVRQIVNKPVDFPQIPGTQKSGLFVTNWSSGGNDEQILKTYTQSDIDRLMSAPMPESEPAFP